MNILAIDYGLKNVGIAVAHDTWVFAREALSYLSDQQLADDVRELAIREHAECLVVGYPLNMSGNASQMTERVERFVGLLRASVDIPVKLWDERLSSAEAERLLHSQHARAVTRKKRRDSLSAKLILESYLAKHG